MPRADVSIPSQLGTLFGDVKRARCVPKTLSQYPRSWALSSEKMIRRTGVEDNRVSIPSQLGTLFGGALAMLAGAFLLVSIPSQLGTLFGGG